MTAFTDKTARGNNFAPDMDAPAEQTGRSERRSRDYDDRGDRDERREEASSTSMLARWQGQQVPVATGTDRVNAAMARVAEQLEVARKHVPNLKMDATMHLSSVSGLRFPVIMLTACDASTAAIYAFAMDDGMNIEPKQVNLSSTERVQVHQGPQDVVNRTFVGKMHEFARVLSSGMNTVFTGATVIPNSMDTSERGHTLIGLIQVGINVLVREFNAQRGIMPFKLKYMYEDGMELEAHVAIGGADRANMLGAPVRTDVSVTLVHQPVSRGRTNRSRDADVLDLNGANGSTTTVIQPAGYIAVNYLPGDGRHVAGVRDVRPMFAGCLVINNWGETRAYDPGQIMAGIATAAVLRDQRHWHPYFFQRRVDPRTNVGALNRLYNLEKILEGNTRVDAGEVLNFTGKAAEQDFNLFMDASFHSYLAVGMAIPNGAPETGLLDMFLRAMDPAEQGEADEQLADLADVLTSGHFRKIWKGQPFFDKGATYNQQTGTFQDKNGDVHPYEEVDTLAVVAKAEDPAIVDAWLDTYNSQDMSWAERAAARFSIVSDIVGEQPKISGTSTIGLFNAEVLTMLQDAMIAADVQPVINDPTMNDIGRGRRAAAWGSSMAHEYRSFQTGRGDGRRQYGTAPASYTRRQSNAYGSGR